MGSNYKEEKKKIKERYNDQQIHNKDGDGDNVFTDNEDDANHRLTQDSNNRKFLQFQQENELDEKSKTFRTRTYSGKDKCTNVKSVVRRFIIIFLIAGIICGAVFLVSKFLAKKKLKTFILDGNEPSIRNNNINGTETIAKLLRKGIKEISLDELGELQLINVQLMPSDLLTNLHGCSRLKSIKLENVTITGEFNDTVYLPALEEFIYNEASPSEEKINNLDIKSAMAESRLKSILFFRQEEEEEEETEKDSSSVSNVDLNTIWSLNINIHITFADFTVLVIDHTKGELVLPWISYLKRDEMIQSAGKDLRRLNCNRLTLSIESLSTKITHLTLRDVKLLGGDFTDLLRKLPKLVDLRVSASDATTLDISELPRKTLRNLALSKFSLFNSKDSSSSSTNGKFMKKFKLDSLSLVSATLSSSVLENLPSLFLTQQLAISEYNIIGGSDSENSNNKNEEEDGNEVTDINITLLQNIIKTQAERILMYKYKGSVNDTLISIKRMLEGKLYYDNNEDLPNNFILEKSTLTSNKANNDDDKSWSFKNLPWDDWHEFKHDALGYSSFWTYRR